MHKRMRLLSLPTAILAIFTLLLLGGYVQAQQQKKLNDMELKELYTDAVVTFTNPNGSTGKNVFRSDGTATVEWKGPKGSGKDQGTWAVKNDAVCTKWKKVRKGKEGCFGILKTGDNEYSGIRPDGKKGATLSFSKL